MCELFAITGTLPVTLNELLKEFTSHSVDHPHGWGMYDSDKDSLIKEPLAAYESDLCKDMLKAPIVSANLFAHIRQATVGSLKYENAHPFQGMTDKKTKWTFMHNGTVFESDFLDKYKSTQLGSTDSERLFLYLLDKVKAATKESQSLHQYLADAIYDITPKNKLNLIFTDGVHLYVHTNMENTLYYAIISAPDGKSSATILSTVPLNALKALENVNINVDWTPMPLSRLCVFEAGQKIFEGSKTGAIYIEEE